MSLNIKIYSPSDFPIYLPKLSALYDDLFSGGKGFRSKLVQYLGASLNLDESAIGLLAQTVEFIHNASLLHDDLIDRSVLRRGKPAAWTKYTPEYAVLAGDYLLARVMVNLSSYGNMELVKYTAQVISDLLEGEWLQDSLVGDFSVQLNQLDRVHNLKTASLFKWCLRAPFMAQGRFEKPLHDKLEEAGTLLGQLFQRGDDLLDFDVRNSEGKALLGDLKSGYLNSFACFCFADLESASREKAKTCQSLNDYYRAVGGEDVFKKLVQAFDDKNQFYIELYQHHILSLKEHLVTDEESKIIDFLIPLTKKMYFRQSSSS